MIPSHTPPAPSARERLAARARHLLPSGHTLPGPIWEQRHHVLLAVLWLHVVAIPAYALIRGYDPGHALLEGVPVASLALLAMAVRGRKLSSSFVSLGLLTCSALVVHISHGVTEAHFYFFVVVVALTVYEDWTPFLLAVGFVLLHHGLGGAFAPEYVFEHTGHPWAWAATHALFVAAAGAAATGTWRLNEQVRHSLRAVVEGSGDAILEVDSGMHIMRGNAAAERILGYSAAELDGLSIADVLAPERQGDIQVLASRTAAGEYVSDHQTVCVRPDGKRVDLALTVSPVTDARGKVVSASIFARDVTEANRQSKALVEAEGLFRGAFDTAPVGMALATVDGVYLEVNPAFCRMLGYTSEELVGRHRSEVTHPEDIVTDAARLERATSESTYSQALSKRYIHKDGSIVWAVVAIAVARDASGDARHVVIQALDETERREADERLRLAEERYRTLVERVPAVTYVAEAGAEGRWHYVSPQIERMLGYTAEEWLANPTLWFARVHPADRDRVLADEAVGDSLASEYRMIARDGRELWVRDEAVFREGDKSEEGYMDGILTDVTERKRLEERLVHMATHDEMTGLLSRGRFEEELREEVAAARRYERPGAVLLLDLDNFKGVNDTLGHPAGDRLLKGVAAILSERLRDTDTVARLGGDEFAVLLREADDEGACAVARGIVERIREGHIDVGEGPVSTTASVGIVLLGPTGDADDADRLLMEADIAMYRAKEAGGDGFSCFWRPAAGRPSA